MASSTSSIVGQLALAALAALSSGAAAGCCSCRGHGLGDGATASAGPSAVATNHPCTCDHSNSTCKCATCDATDGANCTCSR